MKKIGKIVIFAGIIFLIIWAVFFVSTNLKTQRRLNLILLGKEVSVFTLLPGEGAGFLLFPNNTQIEVIHGYGLYPLESIINLERLEGRTQLLTGSVQEALAVPIDGYLKVNDSLKQELLKRIFFQSRHDTSLSWWKIVSLYWQFKKIRPDKINTIDLDKTEVMERITLADESEGWQINKEKIDQLINGFFKEPIIREENLSIGVYNASGFSGLAQRGARLIERLGGRVVKIGDWDKEESVCLIISPKAIADSLTVKKISRIYNCRWQISQSEELPVQVILVLGQDYQEKLGEK